MKRLHVHVSVPDLQKSIDFYNSLFGSQPTITKDDYAKWMLDDPAVNFAISIGHGKKGLNHLGFQVDDDEGLAQFQQRLDAAEIEGKKEDDASCCYANSDKYWTMDPAGIPWEQFHTLADIPKFGEGPTEKSGAEGCGCTPASYIKGKVSGCCT